MSNSGDQTTQDLGQDQEPIPDLPADAVEAVDDMVSIERKSLEALIATVAQASPQAPVETVEEEPTQLPIFEIPKMEFPAEISEAFQDQPEMLQAFQYLYEVASRSGAEVALRALPPLAKEQTKEMLAQERAAVNFYVKYPDLIGNERIVMQVANRIGSADPTKDPQDIFEETAKEVRKYLQLLKPEEAPNSAALPKPSGSRPAQRPPSAGQPQKSISEQIDELVKLRKGG